MDELQLLREDGIIRYAIHYPSFQTQTNLIFVAVVDKRRDTVLICSRSDDVEEGRAQINKVGEGWRPR